MIKLSCGSCGAKLNLTDDVNRFFCTYCGSEWLVEKGDGYATLKAVEEKLDKIETNTGSTARDTEVLADEVRLKKIEERIPELESEKKKIDLSPKIKNPKYVRIPPRPEYTTDSEKNVCILMVVIFLLLLFFFIGMAITDGPNGQSGGCCGLVIGWPIFSFIVSYLLIKIADMADEKQRKEYDEKIKNMEPEFITDDETSNRNWKRYKQIKAEINDIKAKKQKIKDRMLKKL